jgi:hypothetical protein
MSMTRPVAVTLGLAAALAGTAVRADACTCLPKSEICGAASEYWRTAVVFLGRVEAIERPAAKDTPRYLLSRRVRLRVLEPFRGSPPAGSDVIVLTGAGGGDCGYPFKLAQEYLVYASTRRASAVARGRRPKRLPISTTPAPPRPDAPQPGG